MIRSAQLTRYKVSFQCGFQNSRASMTVALTRAGRGVNSRHASPGSSGVCVQRYSMRGDGAMTSKKRHDGMTAGSRSFSAWSISALASTVARRRR